MSLVSDISDLGVWEFADIIRSLVDTVAVVGAGGVEFVQVELFPVPLTGHHLKLM